MDDEDDWDFPVRPALPATTGNPASPPDSPRSNSLEVKLPPSTRRDLAAIESFDDLPLRPSKLAASLLAAAQA